MSDQSQKKTLVRKRGRPATGEGKTLGVRCHPPLLAKIDSWRRDQEDIPTRAAAVRRILEAALSRYKQKR